MDRPEMKRRRKLTDLTFSQNESEFALFIMQRQTGKFWQKVLRRKTSAWPKCEHDDVTITRCLSSHGLQNKLLYVQRLSFIDFRYVSAQERITESSQSASTAGNTSTTCWHTLKYLLPSRLHRFIPKCVYFCIHSHQFQSCTGLNSDCHLFLILNFPISTWKPHGLQWVMLILNYFTKKG